MQEEILNCPTGQFSLVRPGTPAKMPLRAWDAADEYLIEYVFEHHKDQPLNILNDGFGALAISLAAYNKPKLNTLWITDSYCALQALNVNLKLQHSELNLPNVVKCEDEWQSDAHLWLMKIPKSISFLEFQLQRLSQIAQHSQQDQTILLAGMMKHVPKTLMDILSKYGLATRSPFKKKAMLISLTLPSNNATSRLKMAYPKQHSFFKTKVMGHANVFGRDKLDQGTELLLNHMPALEGEHNVADLCCGTGILGLNHGLNHPKAHISFFDECHMAVHCAEQGMALNQLANHSQFCWDDGMKQAPDNQYDLILCNPPFHEQHAVGDHIAWRLFHDANRCLKNGGQFLVVGNRHLAYHTKLKRIFKNTETLASNSKFVVLQSIKRSSDHD